MLLTAIAKQIEAQSRARARRYEAEYLANIFGLDYELPLCADISSETAAPAERAKESATCAQRPKGAIQD